MNKTKRKKFSVITLGCSKNTVDSELLTASLIDKGLNFTENILESNYIIINTCGFIKPAINQSIETIKNVIHTLKDNNLDAKVIVAGCLVSRYQDKLSQKLNEGIVAFYDSRSFLDIPNDLDILESNNEKKIIKTSSYTPDYSSKLSKFISTGYYSYVKIAEGCNHTCSFCTIPLIRGKYKSRPIDDIVEEVKKLVNIGIKEIILVSQDTSFYGYDIYGKLSLDKLLDSIANIDGDFWVRMLYLYPTTLTKNVLQCIAKNDKLVKYIDIPLQHVSQKVLKAMRRPGNIDFYRNMIYQIRNTVPDVVIRSTFIIGHPMEEEEDFDQLFNFLKEVQIERAGFFKYYREKNTYSYSLPQIDYKTKIKRYRKIISLQNKILEKWSTSRLGMTFKTLIEAEEEDYYLGRAYFDAPEVDSTIKIPKKSIPKIKLGNFYNVKIQDYREYDFYGCIS